MLPETESHIDIAKLKWRTHKLRKLTKIPKNHPIIGWDTETFRGYARIIANSRGQHLFIEKQKVSEKTFSLILSFLTQKQYETTHGFFWNIDYDFFDSVVAKLHYEKKWSWKEIKEFLKERKQPSKWTPETKAKEKVFREYAKKVFPDRYPD